MGFGSDFSSEKANLLSEKLNVEVFTGATFFSTLGSTFSGTGAADGLSNELKKSSTSKSSFFAFKLIGWFCVEDLPWNRTPSCESSFSFELDPLDGCRLSFY